MPGVYNPEDFDCAGFSVGVVDEAKVLGAHRLQFGDRVIGVSSYGLEEFEEWKKTGWLTQGSVSKPGLIKRLPWSHVEDRMQYDLLPQAGKLTMPFLTIVGEHDTSTPPDQVEVLYEAVSGPKEMHVIHGAPHTFREQIHLDEIKEITNRWIEKYLMK
jgi:pimeloyl-ACP methyl ester carboxylesterase